MDTTHPSYPTAYPTPEPPQPRRPHPGRQLLAVVAVTALAAGGIGLGGGYDVGQVLQDRSANTTSSGSDQRNAFFGNGTGAPTNGGVFQPDQGSQGSTSTDVTSTATDAQVTGLVRVDSTMKYAGGEAVGTGVVLTSNGEVVTNHHVVAGATSVQVTVMATGQTYTATVVGTDATDDVAVLQLQGASGLSTVTPDQDTVSVGEPVTAVGDAGGTTDFSASTGSLLAQDQTITTQSEQTVAGQRLTNLLEVSADVAPGDSGGATYDAQGEVLGMTTAATSGSGDTTGYAIPIAKVLAIADDLDNHVSGTPYTYDRSAFLGVGLANGTTVLGVYRGTPAADAGLAQGDRITRVDGTAVASAGALKQALSARSPGDRVRIGWTDTAGATHRATLTLTTGPVA